MKKGNPVDKEGRNRISKLITEKTDPVHLSAITKLLQRYDEELIVEAIDLMPLCHPNPMGFIVVYCRNMATEDQKKKNPAITIEKFRLKVKK